MSDALRYRSSGTTERENLSRMLSATEPGHLPLDVWLTEPAADMIEAHTGSRDAVDALGISLQRIYPNYAPNPAAWRNAYRKLGFEIHPDALIGSMGTVDDVPPAHTVGAAYHLLEMRHPLGVVESVDQLESLPWPDVDAPDGYRHVAVAVDRAHARGIAAIGDVCCTAFESAWYLRGMDRLYLDLVDSTGIADWLLDWFTHRAEAAVAAFVRAGVDQIWLGDDVGTQRGLMMAVPFWQEHLKPRLRRVIEVVRNEQVEPVWIGYHSDGDIRPIIEDLIEIGIDILNPIQPECMPVRQTIETYKDRLAFWGMIGTQTTMPFGTPDDVRAAVGELRNLAEHGARIVVSPTHVIEPDVPWENLEALVREVKKPLRQGVSP